VAGEVAQGLKWQRAQQCMLLEPLRLPGIRRD
jgi:hypothetical protein